MPALLLALAFVISGLPSSPAVAAEAPSVTQIDASTTLFAKRKKRKKRRRKRPRAKAKKVGKPVVKPLPKPVQKKPAKAIVAAPTSEKSTSTDEPKKTKVAAAVNNGPRPIKLAAMELRSTSPKIDPKLLPILNELMLAVITEDGRFEQVVSGADLRDLLNMEQQKAALGCEASNCMAEIGKALDVPFMLTAELGMIGGQAVFNLKILDIDRAEVLAREGGVIQGSDGLPDLVRTSAKKAVDSFFAKVKPSATAAAAEQLEASQAIAVLDLEAVHGVKASMAEVLSDILLSRLSESRRFSSIIAGEDLRDMISIEEQKQALGCDDDSCMQSLGGALGVPLMAVPSIGRIGDQFILNLKVIAVEEAKVLLRKSVTVRKEVDLPRAVLKLSEQALIALFGEEAALTATQLSNKFQRNLMRRSAMGFALAAVGTMGWSIVDLGDSQSAHNDPINGMSDVSYDELKTAQTLAVKARWGAIGSAAVAAALWQLAPSLEER
jgi:hypothetical protein